MRKSAVSRSHEVAEGEAGFATVSRWRRRLGPRLIWSRTATHTFCWPGNLGSLFLNGTKEKENSLQGVYVHYGDSIMSCSTPEFG